MLDNILEQSISLSNLATNPWLIGVTSFIIYWFGGKFWGLFVAKHFVKQKNSLIQQYNSTTGNYYYEFDSDAKDNIALNRFCFPLSVIFFTIYLISSSAARRYDKRLNNIIQDHMKKEK